MPSFSATSCFRTVAFHRNAGPKRVHKRHPRESSIALKRELNITTFLFYAFCFLSDLDLLPFLHLRRPSSEDSISITSSSLRLSSHINLPEPIQGAGTTISKTNHALKSLGCFGFETTHRRVSVTDCKVFQNRRTIGLQ
jgi:hypothetical protein